jgi:hypothetical protein
MKISSIWQFPQTILALIIISYYKFTKGLIKTDDYKKRKIYIVRPSNTMTAVSLGFSIIVGQDYDSQEIRDHEYGHTIQSLVLGPFYLFTVGVISALFNLMSRYSDAKGSGKFSSNYYKRWPENQADKFGGVKRN